MAKNAYWKIRIILFRIILIGYTKEETILFPAVAYRTYEKLKDQRGFKALFRQTLKRLRYYSSSIKRAKLIHHLIEFEVAELFKDKVVSENVSCKQACSACCHTQVSITQDEADLLASEIVAGASVDLRRLRGLAEKGNDADEFYRTDYDQRACPFLGEDKLCQVYENRPSVCRTNHVVSDPKACETKDGSEQAVRLLNTHRADMVIMASFKHCKENGALPFMVWKALKRLGKRSSDAVVNKV